RWPWARVMKRNEIFFHRNCERRGIQKSRKLAVEESGTGPRLGWAFLGLAMVLSAFGQDSVLEKARQLDEAGRCAEADALYQADLRSGASVAALNNFGNHYLACREPEK